MKVLLLHNLVHEDHAALTIFQHSFSINYSWGYQPTRGKSKSLVIWICVFIWYLYIISCMWFTESMIPGFDIEACDMCCNSLNFMQISLILRMPPEFITVTCTTPLICHSWKTFTDLGTLSLGKLLSSSPLFRTQKRLTSLPLSSYLPRSYKLNEQNYHYLAYTLNQETTDTWQLVTMSKN